MPFISFAKIKDVVLIEDNSQSLGAEKNSRAETALPLLHFILQKT
jgi:hypothetical protein